MFYETKHVDYSIIAIAVVALQPLCLSIFCIKAFFAEQHNKHLHTMQISNLFILA